MSEDPDAGIGGSTTAGATVDGVTDGFGGPSVGGSARATSAHPAIVTPAAKREAKVRWMASISDLDESGGRAIIDRGL
ncbi:MAG: hypothetical protein M3N13_01810 [Candidatus Eremiobacteraeota bacterium]|nr:hypothetical protein [Candidatus Eremiobacteraeota bacterium]